MRRVVIDVGPLLRYDDGNTVTGIGRVTREFVQSLAGLVRPFEVVLFGQRLRGLNLSKRGMPFPTRQLHTPRWQCVDWITQRMPVVETICRYDLFHATSNFAAIRSPEHAIATIHDAMFLAYPETFLGHGREAERIPQFARRCRAIITCSESSKNDIVRFIGISPAKIHVLPWGVCHDVFHPYPNPADLRTLLRARFGIQRPYFLQVSCDIGRKNSPLVFNSYRALLGHHPDNDLVMVWRKPPREILQVRERDRLEPRIHFINNVPDADLRLLYCGATAMLFPSAYEGFGLPVVEAMACGTPVVTTRCGSLPEVGGDAAIYVDLQESASVAKVMEAFENERYDCARLSANGIRQAARFNWTTYAERIVSIYSAHLS